MAASIPEDTLRRLKYPVLAHENPDGSVTYTHDVVDRKATGTQAGTPLLAKDHSENAERRFDRPTRDSKGRYSK